MDKPPIGQLEARQYRALIEQYDTYVNQFWEDRKVWRRDVNPLSITQFYNDSAEFEMPPTDKQISAFGHNLGLFYSAGQRLLEVWPHEMEVVLDCEQVKKCLTLAFDEWLDEFVAILPERH